MTSTDRGSGRRRKAIAVAGALLGILLVAGAAWFSQPRGERLAQVTCIRCHPRLSVVYQRTNDRQEWERTVRRMEDFGMEVTPDQREEIVGWLADERGH